MQPSHSPGQPAETESDTETSGGRRAGAYLFAGGALVTVAALAYRRRRRRHDDSEMVPIEIRDEPAMLGK